MVVQEEQVHVKRSNRNLRTMKMKSMLSLEKELEEVIAASEHDGKAYKWINRKGEPAADSQRANDSISVITYNVLGPIHGQGEKHHYAPVAVTKWSRRRTKLLEELRSLNPDIFCLQEVSGKGLKETFIPGLKRIDMECSGYSYSVKKDNGGANYHKYIGCAIFYKPSKLTIVASKRGYIKDFIPLDAMSCRSHEFYVDIHSRYNSVVMVMFNVNSSNRTFIVANTHLYWNPEREDIKVAQTLGITKALTAFCEELGYPAGKPLPPVILCGDFNTLPVMTMDYKGSHTAAVFDFLQAGKLESSHPQHPDSWYPTVSGSRETPRLGALSSPWRFTNAYEVDEFSAHKPQFTTKTDVFEGWIDHVWVNSGVDVDMVLSVPVKKSEFQLNMKPFKPIPNQNYPSDHIPLGIVATIHDMKKE